MCYLEVKIEELIDFLGLFASLEIDVEGYAVSTDSMRVAEGRIPHF